MRGNSAIPLFGIQVFTSGVSAISKVLKYITYSTPPDLKKDAREGSVVYLHNKLPESVRALVSVKRRKIGFWSRSHRRSNLG